MPQYPKWTEEEKQQLIVLFPRLSINGKTGPVTKYSMLKSFPNKSWDAIKWKARQLNLKRDFKSVYPELHLSMFAVGYIAGLVDGEGCLSLLRHKRKYDSIRYYPYVSIANTDLDVLCWVKQITGFGSVRRLKHPEPNERTEKWNQRPWAWSKCYTYGIHSFAECFRFLLDVGRFLKIKHKQSSLLLEFINIQSDLPKNEAIRDPNTGLFKRRIAVPHTERQHEIYKEIRQLNKR